METVPSSPPSTQPAITKIANIEELLSVTRAPKSVLLELGASKIEVQVRALTEDEWAEVEKIGADIKAPPKFKDAAKKVPDGFDEEDPDYVRKVVEAHELRSTLALSLGLIGLVLPGATLEAKLAWRKANLPPQVVRALYASIRGLTTDPASLAYFTTPAS